MDELPAYTPQALTDLLPIYRPSDASDDHIHTYTLLQTSTSRQTLSSTENTPVASPTPLHIQTFKTGGFMNRKPHIVISHPNSNNNNNNNKPNTQPRLLAEARFDIHGTGTTIIYNASTINNNSARGQRLELEDSRMQILKTAVGRMAHWWQPLPGNRDVWELTNEYEDVIARFVHSPSTPAQSPSPPPSPSPQLGSGPGRERSNSLFPILGSNVENRSSSVTTTTTTTTTTKQNKKKIKFTETVVGELHVVDALVGEEKEREEILCSAMVVVERMKRRQALLRNKVSPIGAASGVGRDGVPYIPQ